MMIKRIGLRRFWTIAFLCALNLMIAAGYFFVILPEEQQAKAELDAVNSQISEISQRLQNIRSDMAAFKGNYDRYQALNRGGFFSGQDRFAAARALDALREKAGLLGFTYNIDAVQSIANADADASNAVLYKSQIKIENISSVFDMNIYNFIDLLNTSSMQHMRVESFEIKRAVLLTKESLENLSKQRTGLITASLGANWYTMVPKVDPAPAAAGASEFRGR